MSQSAILQAVRDQLQQTFTLDADSCEVGFDGSPKPSCGELYIAVHPANWTGISGDYDLGEEFEVGVTITLRMGVAPKDRWGIAVFLTAPDGGPGLDALCRQAITAIHQSQTVRLAADTYLTNAGAMGGGSILTPFRFKNGGKPSVKGPEWFDAAPAGKAAAECGVAQTITFGRCQRVQDIQDME